MKKQPWMFVSFLVAAAVPWVACSSSSGSSSTATAGTGGHSSTHASASHAASSGVTTGTGGAGMGGGTVGTGGANACMGIFDSDPCIDCLTASCCGELAKCNEDSAGSCLDCYAGQDMSDDCAASPTNGLLTALYACSQSKCGTTCAPNLTPACDAPATAPSAGACFTVPSGGCNPVTDMGCPTAGDTCDNTMGGFKCYSPPPANTAATCAACDLNNGPACVPGNTCVTTPTFTSICAKFCCTDGDCGSGTCKTGSTGDATVGICVTK
jgi:hypothetical protein